MISIYSVLLKRICIIMYLMKIYLQKDFKMYNLEKTYCPIPLDYLLTLEKV